MKAKTIAAACGLSILLLLPYLALQLSPDHLTLYHSHLPASSLVWGDLTYLAIAAAAATLVLGYAERGGQGNLLGSIVWGAVAARITYLCFEAIAAVRGQPVRHPRPTWVITAVFLMILALRRWRPAIYRVTTARILDALVLCGFSALWIVPTLFYQALRPMPRDAAVRLLPTQTAAFDPQRTPTRVVWLLFDELSYDQTFDHRFPGLALPSFDRFKGESVLFTSLAPAGYYTELVIPSFFLGKTISALKSDLNGSPAIKLAGEPGWQHFDAQKTLFADAARAGWTTGIVGWFNPYCRILQGTLSSCFWKDSPEPDGASAESSAIKNAGAPIGARWERLVGKATPPEVDHEQAVTSLMPAAEALIRDEQIRFVYVHLPLPHPTGIYNRKTAMLRAGGSYIDNLALADHALDELMSAIGQTSSAPQTLVIVCSDHSWRTALWKPAPGWTAEDQAASHGKFDPRPVLMIHFPGQTNEMDIPQPYNELGLHSIIDGILRGELTSAAQFEAWLKTSGEPR
ncbi:MAG TPA: sulfatase-like hydrolase/transferase [Acidobacteriaceae bacterium]|nr:sulfatase-like hydrolase/transferase [Acidobacteriaceae bacterium]